MKAKKVLTALLVSAFAVCLTLGITACGDKDNTPTYTVTFALGEGVSGSAPASQKVKSGEKAKKPEPDPTRTDFAFSGWYNGTTEWDFAENTVTADVTLTAHWREYFDVTFDLDGGTAAEGADYTAKKVLDGDAIALPAAPADDQVGKQFTAWQVGDDGEEFGDPGDEVTITKDTVITAYYETVPARKVTYYDFDGSVFDTDEVEYNAAFTPKADTEKPEANTYNVEFIKWVASPVAQLKKNLYIHAQWSYTQSDDKYFTYTATEDNTAYTVAQAETPDDVEGGGTLYLPITHEQKPVIGITPGTSDETAAFASINATTVVIPDAYTEVADYAFANNANITTVLYCKVSDMKYADTNLTKIGSHAFYYMTNLATVFTGEEKTINILNSITEIGDYAFAFQGSLTKTLVPAMADTLSPVKSLVFQGDSVLTKIGESAFSYAGFGQVMDEDSNMIGATITFPASVEEIGVKAFIGARYIYTIAFEENSRCKTIADEAFAASTYASGNYPGFMKNVTIPKSVTTIGYRGFFRQNLASWIFEKGGTEDLTIGNQVFQHQGNDAPTLTSIEFPARLVSIGGNDTSFNYCDELETITFENTAENPSRLTTISKNCFKTNVKLTAVNIPKSVTTIGESAFSECYKLTTVNFEKGGTAPLTIGMEAFSYGGSYSNGTDRGYNLLTSFEFPARTTFIGTTVFKNRHLLSSITFEKTPDGQDPIPLTFDDFAFGGSASALATKSTDSSLPVTSIELPARTESIGEGFIQGALSLTEIKFEKGFNADIPDHFAFVCPALTGITIPDGVKNIGSNAFSTLTKGKYYAITGDNESGTVKGTETDLTYDDLKLSEITELTIPASVVSIGASAFRDLPNLATLTFADAPAGTAAALEIDSNNFDFQSGEGVAALTVTLGTNVKSIGVMFCNNNNLKIVTIKEGLETIKANAFSSTVADTALSEVTLPASLTSIDPTAFAVGSLSAIKVATGNTVYESEEGDNGNLYKKAETDGIRTLCIVPKANATTTYNFANVIIGDNAFLNNAHITTVTLGANVTLGVSAFKGCTELKTLTINAQPTYLADATNEGVFEGCTTLDTVTLDSSVTKLGFEMFRGCAALVSLDLSHITELGVNCFAGCTEFTGSSKGWSEQLTTLPDSTVTKGSGVTKIGLFSGTKIATFDFTHVTSIGRLAFYQVTTLTSVTLQGGTALGAGAFERCTNLASVTIQGTGALKGTTTFANPATEVGVISSYAFSGTQISAFDLSQYNKIGEHAFERTNISTVNLSQMTEINGNAFNGCTQLTEVTIPAAVTTIPAATFQGCTGLIKIVLEGTTLKSLGNVSGIPSANSNLIIIVPDAKVADYRAASNWSNSKIKNKIFGTSTFTITFAVEGTEASNVTLPQNVQDVRYGTSYTLPAKPTETSLAEDVYFAGWKVGNAAELKAAAEQVEITAATTITAVYKKKTTVSFSWGDSVEDVTGAEKPADQKVEKGGKVTDPDVTPTREGFTFKGWKKKGAEDTELWDFTSDTVPEDGDALELVAVWETTPTD